MGSAGKEEGEPAIALMIASSSSLLIKEPLATLCLSPPDDALPVADLPSSFPDNIPVVAPPSSCSVALEGLRIPEVHVLPLSSSASEVIPECLSPLDRATARMTIASSFTCDSSFGCCAVHAKMYLPASSSQQDFTMESSTTSPKSGDAIVHASPPLCTRQASSSENAVAHALLLSSADPWQGIGMDGVVGSFMSPSLLSPEPSRRAFMHRYMNTLLPALKKIHSRSTSISVTEKLSAVKIAADMSLAISARGNNTWSQALIQELASSSTILPPLKPLTVRRKKKNLRKSSTFRGGFYARGSIAKSSLRRAGSHSVCFGGCPHASNVDSGRNSANSSISGYSSPANFSSLLGRGSHASCLMDSHYPSNLNISLRAGNLSYLPKRVKRRHISLPLYVKILRNSRHVRNCGEASAKMPHEASRTATPSISEEHIQSLGGLVPGGRHMDVPLLLEETADYILSLQMQVEALQSLSHFASL